MLLKSSLKHQSCFFWCSFSCFSTWSSWPLRSLEIWGMSTKYTLFSLTMISVFFCSFVPVQLDIQPLSLDQRAVLLLWQFTAPSSPDSTFSFPIFTAKPSLSLPLFSLSLCRKRMKSISRWRGHSVLLSHPNVSSILFRTRNSLPTKSCVKHSLEEWSLVLGYTNEKSGLFPSPPFTFIILDNLTKT